MIRKPKMILEVLEAIEEYFKDDPEIAVDCLLYLSAYLDDADADKVRIALEQMSRCPKCGSELIAYEWDERHTELDDCPKEHFCEYLCPECDKVPAN